MVEPTIICTRIGYTFTAPQHLVCRVVQSLHTNHMQMSIVEVFICRRLHMNTSMIPVCIWLLCRLCTALHTKCCGAVFDSTTRQAALQVQKILAQWHTCQPHTIRLATLVAYSSSGVKLICVDIVLLQGIYYTVKVIKCTA